MAEEVLVRPIMEVTLRPSPFAVLVHRREKRAWGMKAPFLSRAEGRWHKEAW